MLPPSSRITASLILAASLVLFTGCGSTAPEDESSPPAAESSEAAADAVTDEAEEATEEEATEEESTDSGDLGPAGGAVYADPGPDAVQVTVTPGGFDPGSISVPVGGFVTFTGGDDGPHGLYVGDLDGYSVMGGLTASFRFDVAGTYRVFDEISETETTVTVQ